MTATPSATVRLRAGLFDDLEMPRAELARQLDVSPSTVQRYNAGGLPVHPRTVVRMAEVLGVTIGEMFETDDPRPRRLIDPRDCPSWCDDHDLRVDSTRDGSGEVYYGEHRSKPVQVAGAELRIVEIVHVQDKSRRTPVINISRDGNRWSHPLVELPVEEFSVDDVRALSAAVIDAAERIEATR